MAVVDKPLAVAVMKGRLEGLGSCWEGEGCGLESDDNNDLVSTVAVPEWDAGGLTPVI